MYACRVSFFVNWARFFKILDRLSNFFADRRFFFLFRLEDEVESEDELDEEEFDVELGSGSGVP